MSENWSRMKKLIWQRGAMGGPSEVDLTVTGTSPLTLSNALAKPLVSLTQYGKISLSRTPTPTNPATILCNNGRLVCNDDDVPPEYARILGIIMDGNTYYEIDGLPLYGSDTVSFSVSATAACNVFGCYTTASADNNYSLYISTTSGSKYLRYGANTYKSYWSPSALGNRYDITIGPGGSNGMPDGQNEEWDEQEFETSTSLCIGTTSPNATSAKFKGTFYGDFDVMDSFYGIPCERLSDGVIGYFDVYSYTFYEPIGSNPVSLGYDTSNLYIYVYGSAEKVSHTNVGNNKFLNDSLYATGTAADEYEFISGQLKSNTEMMALTGDETFYSSSTYGAAVYMSLPLANKAVTPTCSHFSGIAQVTSGTQNENTVFFDQNYIYFRTSKTPAEFKSWLFEQYAKRTPVILIYGLSTTVTNIRTGWNVTLVSGTNNISVATTSESGGIAVQLTAVYKGTA